MNNRFPAPFGLASGPRNDKNYMLIDGRALAHELNLHTKQRVNSLKFRPLLVDIVAGNDAASLSYVKIKERKALEVGLAFELHQLPENSSTEQVVELITDLSGRPELCGLIIQLPLPKHLDTRTVLDAVPSRIDVDVLNSESTQKFYSGKNTLVPPTAGAISYILDSLPEDWQSKKFLVVGQGDLVGKPITYLLQQRGYQVATADRSTTDLRALLQQADCIISGAGSPDLIKGENIKQDAIVIDAGTSEANGSITGDVEIASVEPKAKYLTPVPGGVGPLTVAKLLENVVLVAGAQD